MKHLIIAAMAVVATLQVAMSQVPTGLRLVSDTPRGHLGETISGDAFVETQRRLLMLVTFDKAAAGQPMDVWVRAMKTTASRSALLISGSVKIDAEGRIPLTVSLPRQWPVGEYVVQVARPGEKPVELPFRVRPESPRSTPLKVSAIELDRIVGAGKSERVQRFLPSDRHWNFGATVEGARTEGVDVRWVLTAVQTTSGSAEVGKIDVPRRPIENTELQFDMELPRDWPVGRYRVELFLNGKSEAMKEFDVRP